MNKLSVSSRKSGMSIGLKHPRVKEKSHVTSSQSAINLVTRPSRNNSLELEDLSETRPSELIVEKHYKTRGKKINFYFLSTGHHKRSLATQEIGIKNKRYKTNDEQVSLKKTRNQHYSSTEEVTSTKKEIVFHFDCSACEFTAPSSCSLKEHVSKIHCKDSFQDLVKMKNIRITDNRDSTSCAICDEDFELFRDLTQHLIDVHKIDNKHCDVCQIKFSSTKCLHIHVNKKHGPSNISRSRVKSCRKCNFHTSSTPEMKTHIKEEHAVSKPCPVCHKKLSNIISLREHIKTIHNKSQEYICNICGKKFGSSRYLHRHISRHDGIRSHVCAVCGKRFNARSTLHCHMEMHKTESERKYQHRCSVCGRGFLGKANLDDHMNKHTGEKPHTCPLCGQRFGFRSMLYKHNQFVHSTLRPHVCTICSKSFKSKYIMLSHMVTHTGISNFNCCHCKRPFSTCSSLQRHIPRCSVFQIKEKYDKDHIPILYESLVDEISTVDCVNKTESCTLDTLDVHSTMEQSKMMEVQDVVAIKLLNKAVTVTRVYVCSECVATFETLEQAETHLTTEHEELMI